MTQVDERKTVLGDGPDNGGESGASKVTFLPEQQARVQELIDEAYRKAFARAQKARGSSEETERLKTEVEKLKVEKKTAALLRAISRHNVVDADEVSELLSGRIKMDDDGRLSVMGETGAAKINSAGAPMTVDEYVASWLSERPHHLRPSGNAGAGSQGARFGANPAVRYDTSDHSIWRSMPRQELDRLLKEGINIQGSAGQTYKFRDVKNPFLEARKRKFQAGA